MRHPTARTALLLAACVFFIAALLTKHHCVSWNDSSRFATIDALAVHRSFAIDSQARFVTGDKYRYGGHFYSDKPPLLALVLAADPLTRIVTISKRK